LHGNIFPVRAGGLQFYEDYIPGLQDACSIVDGPGGIEDAVIEPSTSNGRPEVVMRVTAEEGQRI
jgi:hypothetical protein